MSDLGQLIADLESAQVGSLHYDKRILAALGFTWRGMAYWNSQEQWKGSAALTQSIDAIVALIARKLPGRAWMLSSPDKLLSHPLCQGEVAEGEFSFETTKGCAPTPALALCIAFLRALQAQQEVLNAPS